MRTAMVFLVLVSCKGQGSAPPSPAISSAPALSSSAVPPPPPAAPPSSVASGSSSERTAYDFDKDAVGAAPAGFGSARTGRGREGKWIVRAESDAPSGPNVVAQTDTDSTDDRFAVLYANAPVLADVNVSVRCKPVSGKIDQACGLVARYYDANDYYLTRANALENNVRLYFVKDGKRQQIASWSGKVTSGEWHTLQMIVHGDHFVVSWDKTKVIEHDDKTFMGAGQVGLWTKADSVTEFDDLRVGPLVNL